MEETTAQLEDQHKKLIKERKFLEEQNASMIAKLAEEEDRGKQLVKQRGKYDTQVHELEEQLTKERQVRNIASLSYEITRCLLVVARRLGKDTPSPRPRNERTTGRYG